MMYVNMLYVCFILYTMKTRPKAIVCATSPCVVRISCSVWDVSPLCNLSVMDVSFVKIAIAVGDIYIYITGEVYGQI